MKTCKIFGVRTGAFCMAEALDWVCEKLDELKGQYITFANTHVIVTAGEKKGYCRIQNGAAMVFADGAPVADYQKKHGFPKAERVAGPDFMEEIFRRSPKEGYRHYFYGSSRETLCKLKNNLEKRFPGIEIVGMYAPPFEKNLKKDYREDIERINAAKPDFIWVGLGAPKQEQWMYRQRGKVCGLMLGVGAGFDFHAGVVKRAPKWMQQCKLEWFYRFLQEPYRLGKRYLETNLKFIWWCMREQCAMEKIDFVITWVDGNDKKWLAKKKEYEKRQTGVEAVSGEKETEEREKDVRYRDWGLLPYLFRGIEQYAPWVNHVFLVTDHQVPKWLNADHPKLSVVYHDEFIPACYLPTFNSHTIELNLHRIPGLSEQFVYFNDDCFLTGACRPEDFFWHGLPVDEASLNGINGKDNEFANIQFHNMALMNCHYSVKDCKKHLSKWLKLSYGRNLFRTLFLLPFQRLQGIYNPHGPMPVLKKTCRKLWERDGDVLDETCRCRFRRGENVSAYIFRYEQLLSNRFYAHRSFNKYCPVTEPASVIAGNVRKYKMVCINDAELEEKQFLRKRKEIQKIMESVFPSKSAFEKEKQD